MALSKFDLENFNVKVMGEVKILSYKVGGIRLFEKMTLKIEVQGHSLRSTSYQFTSFRSMSMGPHRCFKISLKIQSKSHG